MDYGVFIDGDCSNVLLWCLYIGLVWLLGWKWQVNTSINRFKKICLCLFMTPGSSLKLYRWPDTLYLSGYSNRSESVNRSEILSTRSLTRRMLTIFCRESQWNETKWTVSNTIGRENHRKNAWDEINRKENKQMNPTCNEHQLKSKVLIFSLWCWRLVSGHCRNLFSFILSWNRSHFRTKTNPTTYAWLVKLYWCS